MNSFSELVVLRDVGIEFHNREAECEKERSYSAVLDLGTDKRPFEDDLNDRSRAIDIVSRSGPKDAFFSGRVDLVLGSQPCPPGSLQACSR